MTDQHQTEAQRLAALLRSRNNNQAGFGLGPVCDEAAVELLRLNSVHADLERVSMQLVACGVVAMADTPDSAKKARAMHPDYESASCDDVKRRVDECIELRARVAELEDMLANLPLSSLQRLRARIQRLEEMLAAVGAGGVGPLIPSKLTARDIADSALLGNIESPFNACMHQEHCKRWKKEAEAEQQFSARDDAERLKSVARGMSYNDHGEAVWKHTLMEIAVRLEAGGYAAPQPPTTEQSSAVEQPRGGQEPDWQDLYQKEKRRAEMWVAKYGHDIGKLERAVPVAGQPRVEQEPVASLADAIRSEPTELIHKWRVLELIQDHAKQQPKRDPLTDEAKAAIDAARAAMDESTESYSGRGDISIPSELAAALSLRLDEYDRTIEAAHGIGSKQ